GKRECSLNLGGSANIRNARQAGIFTSQAGGWAGWQDFDRRRKPRQFSNSGLAMSCLIWHCKCLREKESPPVSQKGPDNNYVEARDSSAHFDEPQPQQT